ncbi:peptide chain release factor 1 [Flavobacterium akiainvivens]|uniref:Peptide chain release factor 1 n=1 Tax=Flavobacterium akiainvivens TaxID=1202724 RepID=A0A0M8MJ47_9FLAO|nr:alternative ribosome rescue aminoacyl-tRNA hydrolase ArfB [Flavobacterium akiainvivens]KOS06628.1 peptide chain release factor 1 [Flavobacterium akiainvivens]SFQ08741.1 ribosome-associated protein [Flavobacterium akiainvivens]
MDTEKIISELQYKAVRSSGSGGQNVNKVSSKVVLSFSLPASGALTDEEKALVQTRLSSRLTESQTLVLQCDEDRSQFRNKHLVTQRFLQLIENALKVDKPRKATRIPKAVVKKRLDNKRRQGEIKQSRKKPNY